MVAYTMVVSQTEFQTGTEKSLTQTAPSSKAFLLTGRRCMVSPYGKTEIFTKATYLMMSLTDMGSTNGVLTDGMKARGRTGR